MLTVKQTRGVALVPGARRFNLPLISALEPRFMFDGAAVATGVDALDGADDAGASDGGTSSDGGDTADASSESADLAAAFVALDGNRGVSEIVFVDAVVRDVDQLLDGISENALVVMLDADGDGVQQIADVLANYSDISAVHILSHGGLGGVTLGSTELNYLTIDDHADALSDWGASLAEGADILIYGCSVGTGDNGRDFVQTMSDLTGADIAASDDVTTGTLNGGDWTLEVTTGQIDTSIVISTSAQLTYDYSLANVLIFANASYTDWAGEGTNFKTSFEQSGHTVTTTTVLDGTLSDALAGKSAFAIPDLEVAALLPAVSAEWKTDLQTFVNGGGNLIISGDGTGRGLALMNDLFSTSFSLGGSSGIDSTRSNYANNSAPATLAGHNAIYAISGAAADTIAYSNANGATALAFIQGSGNVTYLAYDFFDYQTSFDDWDSVVDMAVKKTLLEGVSVGTATPVVKLGGTEEALATGGRLYLADGDYNNATLKIQITANNEATDTIKLIETGGITINTGTGEVTHGGSVFATADVAAATVTNGSALTFTFNANANLTRCNALMEALRFAHTDANVSASADRTVTFTFTDAAPVSAYTGTVTVTAGDAPSFSGAGALGAVNEDTSSPAGATVTSIMNAKFSDGSDSDSLSGIAVSANTANATTQGAWQYTTDGTNWYDVGTVSTASALLLDTSAKVRFVPVANYSGTPTALTVYAVDNDAIQTLTYTSGSTRQTFDTTTDSTGSRVSAAGVDLTTSVTTVADTPSVTDSEGVSGQQTTTGLVLTRNAADSTEVTHFKITSITGGTLYKNDGTTEISNGDFITYAEGNAGLKFTPSGSSDGTFKAQASTSSADGGLGGSLVTATVAVSAPPVAEVEPAPNPPAPPPVVVAPSPTPAPEAPSDTGTPIRGAIQGNGDGTQSAVQGALGSTSAIENSGSPVTTAVAMVGEGGLGGGIAGGLGGLGGGFGGLGGFGGEATGGETAGGGAAPAGFTGGVTGGLGGGLPAGEAGPGLEQGPEEQQGQGGEGAPQGEGGQGAAPVEGGEGAPQGEGGEGAPQGEGGQQQSRLDAPAHHIGLTKQIASIHGSLDQRAQSIARAIGTLS